MLKGAANYILTMQEIIKSEFTSFILHSSHLLHIACSFELTNLADRQKSIFKKNIICLKSKQTEKSCTITANINLFPQSASQD